MYLLGLGLFKITQYAAGEIYESVRHTYHPTISQPRIKVDATAPVEPLEEPSEPVDIPDMSVGITEYKEHEKGRVRVQRTNIRRDGHEK